MYQGESSLSDELISPSEALTILANRLPPTV